MKKLLISISILIGSLIPVGIAHAHTSQFWICNTPSLKVKWEYPTGTYWVNQIALYPDYYASHNALYLAKYGC